MGELETPVQLGRHAPLPLLQRHTVSDSWALNTYDACDVRCTYCITNAQGISTPRYRREEITRRLHHEMDRLGEISRLVVGPYCDVYPSTEVVHRVTRAALEVLSERDQGFVLITKGTDVLRDTELFRHPRTNIEISLCSLDEAALARIEPGAASPERRLATLHELASRGICTTMQLAPWIPGLSDAAALVARVDPSIEIQVTPLRLPEYLGRAHRAFGLTQAEVNEAFRQEFMRVGPRPNVRWSRPPALDGAPPHITDNIGSRAPSDWSPAPSAPDPGPPVLTRAKTLGRSDPTLSR